MIDKSVGALPGALFIKKQNKNQKTDSTHRSLFLFDWDGHFRRRATAAAPFKGGQLNLCVKCFSVDESG